MVKSIWRLRALFRRGRRAQWRPQGADIPDSDRYGLSLQPRLSESLAGRLGRNLLTAGTRWTTLIERTIRRGAWFP
jgi:hypothetical protein